MTNDAVNQVDKAAILAQLLSSDHGWWFDEICQTVGRNGKFKYRLRDKPYFSYRFLEMYGHTSKTVSLKKVIHPEFQHRAMKEMRRVIVPGGLGVSGTIIAITAGGEQKLVEVYARRVELDGRAYFASLHSDLTVSTDEQWIERTVLQRLQAFVFVKTWKPEVSRFEFIYANKRLYKALGCNSASEMLGKSDADFFGEGDPQVAAFRRDDELVRDSRDKDKVLLKEETFLTGVGSTSPKSDGTRLLTFKTPFWPPSRGKRNQHWDVLGIAVDITPVTDILRAVVNQSSDGLYVKDQDGRYRYVNQQFMTLLGCHRDVDVINRTFAEIANANTGASAGSVRTIVDSIAREDELVLSGVETSRVRTAVFHNQKEWISEKRPVESADGIVTHILGITSQLFPKYLGQVLDRMPHSIVVKRVEHLDLQVENLESIEDDPAQLQVVWANERYIDSHRKHGKSHIVGKTDFELWAEYPEQARAYRSTDIAALRARLDVECDARILASRGEAPWTWDQKWRRLVEYMKANGCWEYRETQVRAGKQHVLQTSKWAEIIGGVAFVIVVYSDVTLGDAAQQDYNRLTVHSIRGATAPLSVAEMYLSRAETSVDIETMRQNLASARRCLSATERKVNQFLHCHLDLLRMNMVMKEVAWVDFEQVVKNESSTAAQVNPDCRVSFTTSPVSLQGRAVKSDIRFLKIVVSELIHNAIKSTRRRQWLEDDEYPSNGDSDHDLGLGLTRDPSALLSTSYLAREEGATGFNALVEVCLILERNWLIIKVSDNGIATIDDEHWAECQKRFKQAQALDTDPTLSRLGLRFCAVVSKRHGGYLEVYRAPNTTIVEVRIKPESL